ncbi:MAG: hypothetical protein HGA80_05910 [Candidatus Omnitrophica bacterium]|nr:hypothetical protein [Candidatus Omnitrophota bacterium]
MLLNAHSFKKILCGLLALVFAVSASGVAPAQGLSAGTGRAVLPEPGGMLGLSPAFAPALLKGIKVYRNDPLRFDFILDQGDVGRKTSNVQPPASDQLRSESTHLIKYFLASLTVPEKDLWVNLSPYEKDRIVPEAFGQTEMGRDLLAQDYILKQITASVIYPEGETGKAFWAKVYAEAQKRFGTTDIPVDTFNKVWIVPEKATVYENKDAAFVVESQLKVMLESDYLAEGETLDAGRATSGVERQTSDPKHAVVNSQQKNDRNLNDALPRSGADPADRQPLTADLSKQLLREIVIPILEKEVNEGANFAPLRQVYHSLILATWYKRKIKASILGQAYVDHQKTAGIDITDKGEAEKIWARYVEAFRKGAYNYIKEEYDPALQQTIPRKYFSGGVAFGGSLDQAMQTTQDAAQLSKKVDGLASIQAELVPRVKNMSHAEMVDRHLVESSLIPDMLRRVVTARAIAGRFRQVRSLGGSSALLNYLGTIFSNRDAARTVDKILAAVNDRRRIILEVGSGRTVSAVRLAQSNPDALVIATDEYNADILTSRPDYLPDAQDFEAGRLPAQKAGLDNLLVIRSLVDILLYLPDASIDNIVMVYPDLEIVRGFVVLVQKYNALKKFRHGYQAAIVTPAGSILQDMKPVAKSINFAEQADTTFRGVDLKDNSDWSRTWSLSGSKLYVSSDPAMRSAGLQGPNALSQEELDLLKNWELPGAAALTSKWSRDDARIKGQVRQIEQALGNPAGALAKAEQVIKDLTNAAASFMGEEVHVLDGTGAEARVIGRLDRRLAEHYGYAHETANVVVVYDGKVILQMRNAMTSDDHLAMTGGHLHVGEPPAEAALAESREENSCPEISTAPGFIGYQSFDHTGITNRERRAWFVLKLSGREYQAMQANIKAQQEAILQAELGKSRDEITRAEHKEALFREQVNGRGHGEVLGYYEFTFDQIESSPTAVDTTSPFADQTTHFLDVVEHYQGQAETVRAFFSTGSFNPLLSSPYRELWSAIKQAAAAASDPAMRAGGDTSRWSARNNVRRVNLNINDFVDLPAIKNNLLSKFYVGYAMAMKLVVNPDDRPMVGVYGGSGADISSFLLATNATNAFFVDKTIVRESTLGKLLVEGVEGDWDADSYKREKFEQGFATSGDSTGLSMITLKIVTELAAMGIKPESVSIVPYNGYFELHSDDWGERIAPDALLKAIRGDGFTTPDAGNALGTLNLLLKDTVFCRELLVRIRDRGPFQEAYWLIQDILAGQGADKQFTPSQVWSILKKMYLNAFDDKEYHEPVTIKFKWAYPGQEEKERTLTFVYADMADPSRYPHVLKDALREGIDLYYQRAGFFLPMEYEKFVPSLAKGIKPGGFLLTDDNYYYPSSPNLTSLDDLLSTSNIDFFGPEQLQSREMQYFAQRITEDRQKHDMLSSRPGYGWQVRIRRLNGEGLTLTDHAMQAGIKQAANDLSSLRAYCGDKLGQFADQADAERWLHQSFIGADKQFYGERVAVMGRAGDKTFVVGGLDRNLVDHFDLPYMAVAGIFELPSGEVVFPVRAPHKRQGLSPTLPGGYGQFEQTPEENILSEIKDELGLKTPLDPRRLELVKVVASDRPEITFYYKYKADAEEARAIRAIAEANDHELLGLTQEEYFARLKALSRSETGQGETAGFYFTRLDQLRPDSQVPLSFTFSGGQVFQAEKELAVPLRLFLSGNTHDNELAFVRAPATATPVLWSAQGKVLLFADKLSRQATNYIFIDGDNFIWKGFDQYFRLWAEIYYRAENMISLDRELNLTEADLDPFLQRVKAAVDLADPQRIPEMFKSLKARGRTPPNSREEYEKYFEAHFSAGEVERVEGADVFFNKVAELKKAGFDIRLILLSNSSEFQARVKVDKLGLSGQFDAVLAMPWDYDAQGIRPGTFKADQILEVVRQSDGDRPVFAVFGGDKESDVHVASELSARGLSMVSFGVPSVDSTASALLSAGAQVVVHNLSEADVVFASLQKVQLFRSFFVNGQEVTRQGLDEAIQGIASSGRVIFNVRIQDAVLQLGVMPIMSGVKKNNNWDIEAPPNSAMTINGFITSPGPYLELFMAYKGPGPDFTLRRDQLIRVARLFVESGFSRETRLDELTTGLVKEMSGTNTAPTTLGELAGLAVSDDHVDNAMVPGGIDLNAGKIDLKTQSAGGDGIEFRLDPALLKQVEEAPGMTPVIIGIQPIESLPMFLGLRDEKDGAQKASATAGPGPAAARRSGPASGFRREIARTGRREQGGLEV